jgi:hypothetical protein
MTAPTPHERAVEKIREDYSAHEWPTIEEGIQAYLAAMEAEGWKLCPRVADEAMTQAMHSALYYWRERPGGNVQQDPNWLEKHQIRFAAAYDAAPSPSPQREG